MTRSQRRRMHSAWRKMDGLFPARTWCQGLKPPRQSHVFCGRHATRDASQLIFLASKAAPVLGQTLMDRLASNHGSYFAAACLGSVVSVPPVNFFSTHPCLYNFVQISEISIWNVFRSLHRYLSYLFSHCQCCLIACKFHLYTSGLVNNHSR